MRAFAALVSKNLRDSRWLLVLSAAVLFAWSWLLVYGTFKFERQLRQADPSGDVFRSQRTIRGMGGPSMDFSSTALELVFWNHPIVVLTVCLWAIGRGSVAIAGELERGTLDLTLSRPISRFSYYLAQVAVALCGLMVLSAALVAGNLAGGHYNAVEDPPRTAMIVRAGLNVTMLGFAIFGYALLFSSLDVVRWRPTLIAASVTIVMYIARIVGSLPGLDAYEWLARYSMFRAYDPVEAAIRGEHLPANVGLLAAVAGLGAVLGLIAFSERDLPTGGG
jgi:ABC-2 type transport system permease protein